MCLATIVDEDHRLILMDNPFSLMEICVAWSIISHCSTKRYILLHRSNTLKTTFTHLGRVAHICVRKIIIIGSDNGLSPGRRQAIIWTNAGILLIDPIGTNFSEILIEVHTFSYKQTHLKMSSAKWRLFRPGLPISLLFVRLIRNSHL